jgi:hypothetical protein
MEHDTLHKSNAQDILIPDMRQLLSHHSHPSNFVFPLQTPKNMYQWVIDNFNGAILFHQLALLMGSLMFCAVPHVHSEGNNIKPALEGTKTYQEAFQRAKKIVWVKKEGHGRTVGTIHMSMLMTWIIGLYEEDSPLQDKLCEYNKLGDVWTGKHQKQLSITFRYEY